MFSILAAKPKSSERNKTGSWRSTKMPRLLKKECINCGLCAYICPEGCIEGKDKNQYSVDLDYCKGCGLCAYICPKNDVKMVENQPQGESKEK
ncbi:MAG: 4Fe-4S binding protein [Candidatus Omnitrophica bacterium]|nr:4Fe-4S binding protein [Candidatus Omnitrophota bacterium]MCF7892318.1 4Fe-4S binding protein [Candidatus Omnitrophota bacterium]MCF7895747.1 4Fe-4S binding protein [Candidatus Omnitrophota bacterium]MCF7897730.1 4Fe-4S binding protein [Candidatus Omnitrophota bacterium]MCF7909567.1 4Fe-4S binding protein [Candidatus Omnitrophota bacterium]